VEHANSGAVWRKGRFGPRLGWSPPLLVVLLALHACAPRPAWGGPKGDDRRIVVTPFQADSAERDLQGRAVAESLSVRLAGVQGLQARLGLEAEGADFVVRGEIGARDGRLVIATRLQQAGASEVLWTATFWRKDSLDSELIGDLAAGVAEAIYGRLAREAVTMKRGKP